MAVQDVSIHQSPGAVVRRGRVRGWAVPRRPERGRADALQVALVDSCSAPRRVGARGRSPRWMPPRTSTVCVRTRRDRISPGTTEPRRTSSSWPVVGVAPAWATAPCRPSASATTRGQPGCRPPSRRSRAPWMRPNGWWCWGATTRRAPRWMPLPPTGAPYRRASSGCACRVGAGSMCCTFCGRSSPAPTG